MAESLVERAAKAMCQHNCRVEIYVVREPCGTHLALAQALFEQGFLKEPDD